MVRNKSRPIWTADCETDPFKKGRIPKPFIWGIYTDEGEYHEFFNTESFIEFIWDKKVIIYAHNGGKFDWHFIADYIPDYSRLTIIAGRLAKFEIGDMEFRDSYNLIPAPLSAYKKDDFDYAILEEVHRHDPENWKKIRAYLKNDCIYLHEMVSDFIEKYGVNLTQASTAMKVWSKMSGIKKPDSGPFYYESMKKYYYGGRVECFKKGIIDQPFKVVDIHSAYPFAMVHDHPWGGTYSSSIEFPEDFNDDDICRSFITLETEALGAFPIRTSNGLSFPNDGERMLFHITGWEYIAARDTKTLGNAAIKEVRYYHEQINFKEYVEYFFEMKDQAKEAGDNAGYLFAKIFLNSLYGKFASNPENYEEFMTIPGYGLDTAIEDGWYYAKMLSTETAVVNRPLPEERRKYYDVAVAASITGFVRAYLWRNICACDGTIYCDTDSIAATDIRNVNISKSLGAWGIDAECDHGAVAGKKLYAFHKADGTYSKNESAWKLASKGVRLEAREIIDIAKGATITYIPDAPTFSIKRAITFQSRKIKMTGT